MFSSSPLWSRPPPPRDGMILSLSDIENYWHWNPNAEKEVEVGQRLKTDGEIQADCLDESLTGVARSLHLLNKGAAIQRWIVLDSLWNLLETEGALAFDALFPPLLKSLCTWDNDVQIHAAGIYLDILDRTKALALRIKKREEEEIFQYDVSQLPVLPWKIDQERLEKWIVPTILLMSDSEGSTEKESTAQAWLEPLYAILDMISLECKKDKILSFALHKRDPTGSVNSRIAAAKVMGHLTRQLTPSQVQDSLFLPLLTLCQDPHPLVRTTAVAQIAPLTKAILLSSSNRSSSTSSTTAASKSALNASAQSALARILSELETIANKDQSPTYAFDSNASSPANEAIKCLVDVLELLPDSIRKQRVIPFFRMYCNNFMNIPASNSSTTSTSASPPAPSPTHSHSSSNGGLNNKSMLLILLRYFGEFLWKVSADLLPPNGNSTTSSATGTSNGGMEDGPSQLKFFITFYKTTAMNAYNGLSSNAALVAPLITFPPTNTSSPSSSTVSDKSSSGSPNSGAASGSSSNSNGANAAAGASSSPNSAAAGLYNSFPSPYTMMVTSTPSPSVPLDVELRRTAAFHFPAIVKIALGGHCNQSQAHGASSASTSSSSTPSATSAINSSLSQFPNLNPSLHSSNSYTSGSSSSGAAASNSTAASGILVSNLPAKTLLLLDSLHALYVKFSLDPDVEVRRIAASYLHVLLSLWPGELILKHFKELLLGFLSIGKLGLPVTEAMLAHLENCLDSFYLHKGDEPFIPMLGEILNRIIAYETNIGLNWRKRVILFQQAHKSYCRIFHQDLVNLHEKFIPILFEAMKNGPIPVKEAAIETLVAFIRQFPYTYRRQELCNRIMREFGMNKSFMCRMLYCEIVKSFFHAFSYRWIKRHIFPQFLSLLRRDAVANVRRKFVQVLPLLKYSIKSSQGDQQLLEQYKAVVAELAGKNYTQNHPHTNHPHNSSFPTSPPTTHSHISSTHSPFSSTNAFNPFPMHASSSPFPPSTPETKSITPPASAGLDGDKDKDVRMAAQTLWDRMYAIDINTEYDRLNRKKEAEEDSMDREEENLSLSSSSTGGNGSSSVTAGKKGLGGPEKRRNHSVIVTSSSSASLLSKDKDTPASTAGAMQPNSARIARAKLKSYQSSSDSPPASPLPSPTFSAASNSFTSPGSAIDLATSARPRQNSVIVPSSSGGGAPGGGATSRPGSSLSNATAAPPRSSSSLKVSRGRSHSVLVPSSSSSSLTPAQQLAATSSGNGVSLTPLSDKKERDSHPADTTVKEEEEEDEPNSPLVPAISPPQTKKSIVVSSPPSTTTSLLSPTSNASTPKGESGAKRRRPSMLSVTSTPSSLNGSDFARSPITSPMSVSPQPPSPMAPLNVTAISKSPRIRGTSAALVSSAPLEPVPPPPAALNIVPSAQLAKGSIISALLRGQANVPTADKLADKLGGVVNVSSYFSSSASPLSSDEPLSAPAFSISNASPLSRSGNGSFSSANSSPGQSLGLLNATLTTQRFKSHANSFSSGSPGSGGTSARGAASNPGSGQPEEKLVLPRLGNYSNSSPANSTSGVASTSAVLSPRVQRMNLQQTNSNANGVSSPTASLPSSASASPSLTGLTGGPVPPAYGRRQGKTRL